MLVVRCTRLCVCVSLSVSLCLSFSLCVSPSLSVCVRARAHTRQTAELFNLKDDPGEENNLATTDAGAAKVAELTAAITAMSKTAGVAHDRDPIDPLSNPKLHKGSWVPWDESPQQCPKWGQCAGCSGYPGSCDCMVCVGERSMQFCEEECGCRHC